MYCRIMRIQALVLVLLLVVANGEYRDHKCTCKRYRDMCNQCDVGAGRCCSRHGYCSSTDCPPPDAAAAAGTGLLVPATYNDRNLIPQASDRNLSIAWRRSYGWVTICGPSTVVALDHVQARRCLKVTNRVNGKEAVVRIVEKECRSSNTSGISLELDYVVFQRLHQSGNRNYVRGHLLVSYHYVHCIE